MAKSKNLITIKDGWEISIKASEKSSEIMRQMALGGIGVIWIFKTQTSNSSQIPQTLILPIAFFAAALLLDLVQTIVKSEWWRIATKQKEDTKVEEFTVTPWLGRTVDFFYWVKMIAMLAGYILLIWFLIWNLFFPIPEPPTVQETACHQALFTNGPQRAVSLEA